MKSECLPFRQIPHSSNLFLDFLSNHSKVDRFYPRSAHFKSWLQDEAARVRCDSARREQVAAILERQNRSWGASQKTLENLARLRAGAFALVTGQQVGLFGGPFFSLLKALTAIRLAEIASKAGVECVPIFWLATEDHDLAEIDHVSLSDRNGLLRTLSVASHGAASAPVGHLTFGDEIQVTIDKAAEVLGDPDTVDTLRHCYRPGENFGSAFARLFSRIFAEWGVILLDATDPELHQIAKPIFRAALDRSAELDDGFLSRGKALESAGYHQQVKVTSSSTLLFCLHEGSRVVVHRRTNGSRSDRGDFVIGEEQVSRADLLKRVDEKPQDFSANVLLRPVVQDYLLPTLAYAGGSAEVAYFAQVAVTYEALLGRITPIVPRFSATIIDAKAQSLLEKYRLRVPAVFQGSEALRQELATRVLPADLQNAFAEAESSLEKSLAAVQAGLTRLDPTLADAAKTSASKMRYQLDKLRSRAARAELRRSEVIGRHAEFLSNSLFPNGALQEREIGGVSLLAHHGQQFLRDLYETINPDCLDHQLISVS